MTLRRRLACLRVRCAPGFLLCASGFVLCAPARPQAQATQDFVAGTVLDRTDEHPIARATVSLIEVQNEHTSATTVSDQAGRFRFPAVKPGKYRLTGSAPGYFTSGYLAHGEFSTAIVTGAGLTTTDLDLHIARAARLYGRVVDGSGDPIAEASVTLYEQGAEAQHSGQNEPPTMTNDDGEYEFPRLSPGRYFLSVSAAPWDAVRAQTTSENPLFEQVSDPALNQIYPFTYYPNVSESAQAEAIALNAGSQVAANFQLTARPPASLRVRVPGGQATRRPDVALERNVFGTWEQVPDLEIMPDGDAFILTGVAPGAYRLRQADPETNLPISRRPIELSGDTGSVTLGPASRGATVTIKAQGDLPAGMAAVSLLGQVSDDPATLAFDEQKNAVFENVPPGRYLVTAVGADRQGSLGILSVTQAGKLRPDQSLDIGKENVSAEIVLTHTVKAVAGFASASAKAAPGSMVILVPAGPDGRKELYRRDQCDLDGSFAFFNVLPGRYLVLAVEDSWSVLGTAWTDTTALAPYLAHALPLEVPPTGEATFQIRQKIETQAR